MASITVRGCTWTRNDPGQLDLLSTRAVRAFIDEAYQPIADAFPEDLGKTIAGFFTDEPRFAGGDVPAGRVDAEGRKYLFLANMTPGAKTLDISWAVGRKIECWDADSGERWSPEQSSGSLAFTLPEDQFVWFVQVNPAVESRQAPAQFLAGAQEAVELLGDWLFETERPNLLSLDYRLKVDKDGTFSHETVMAEKGWLDTD